MASELRKVLDGQAVLGLKAVSGVPERPEGPALACRVRLVGAGSKTEAAVTILSSDEAGTSWSALGKFTLPVALDEPARSRPRRPPTPWPAA